MPDEHHGPTPGAPDRALRSPVVESVKGADLEGVEVDSASGQAMLPDVGPNAKFDPGIRVCENPRPRPDPGQASGPGTRDGGAGPGHNPLARIDGGLRPLHEVVENGRELGTGSKHCDGVVVGSGGLARGVVGI